MKERVCAVEHRYQKDKLFATMELNDQEVQFQLDSGATVNILPEETFKQLYGEDSVPLLDNAEVTLIMYNKTEEKPLGKKRVRVVSVYVPFKDELTLQNGSELLKETVSSYRSK